MLAEIIRLHRHRRGCVEDPACRLAIGGRGLHSRAALAERVELVEAEAGEDEGFEVAGAHLAVRDLEAQKLAAFLVAALPSVEDPEGSRAAPARLDPVRWERRNSRRPRRK